MATRSGPSFVKTLAGVILAIVALFFIDTLLEKTERAESRVEAARFYTNGQRLLQQGKSAEAIDQFRSAISVERDNQDYQLALAQALLAAGRPADAEATLNELLLRNPVGAATNLAMARVFVKQNEIDNAISYYHRAIYGQWKEKPLANQNRVRYELVDLLSQRNSKEVLLAELLPLEEESPDDVMTRKRLGHLFIDAGSPARAADIFRDILREYSRDPDAYIGLGEAELARGNYRTAQAQFLAVIRLRPDDQDARDRLKLCNQVLDLDPTRRGLSPEEQYKRSRKLVELLVDDVARCLGTAASPSAQDLITTVQEGMKKPVSAARRSAVFENNLDWADQLWHVRKAECKQPIPLSQQPVALVLAMMAR